MLTLYVLAPFGRWNVAIKVQPGTVVVLYSRWERCGNGEKKIHNRATTRQSFSLVFASMPTQEQCDIITKLLLPAGGKPTWHNAVETRIGWRRIRVTLTPQSEAEAATEFEMFAKEVLKELSLKPVAATHCAPETVILLESL